MTYILMEVSQMTGINRQTRAWRWGKGLLLATILLSLIFSVTLSAIGYSSYNKKLPDGGSGFSCTTCHEGNNLNEFGVDFMDNGNKYDDVLAARDSDGDGFTNAEEFGAESPTNPGDNASYPGSNTTGNNTGDDVDTSAYLGPIEMKSFVATFYTIIIPLIIGVMVVLVIAEGILAARNRLKERKTKSEKTSKSVGIKDAR
jgi:hypothetical protein